MDGGGNIVVADREHHRIQVLRGSDGAFVRAIGEKGSGLGQLKHARGVEQHRG